MVRGKYAALNAARVCDVLCIVRERRTGRELPSLCGYTLFTQPPQIQGNSRQIAAKTVRPGGAPLAFVFPKELLSSFAIHATAGKLLSDLDLSDRPASSPAAEAEPVSFAYYHSG